MGFWQRYYFINAQCQKTCTNGSHGPVTGTYYRFIIHGAGLEEIPSILERKQPNGSKSKMHPLLVSV